MTFLFLFFIYGRYTTVPCHVLGNVLALFDVTLCDCTYWPKTGLG